MLIAAAFPEAGYSQRLRDTTVCSGDFVTLEADGGYEIYRWSPRDSMVWAVRETAVVSPAYTTRYTLRARRRLREEYVVDGEFDGGGTGSTSGLSRVGASSFAPGTYAVVGTSAELRDDTSACPERSGAEEDRFLAVHGTAGQVERAWCQRVPVREGEIYNFGATLSTLRASTLGRVGFMVEGAMIGGYVSPYRVPCTWRSHGVDYAADETTEVEVCVILESPAVGGSRVAIDAVTFRQYDVDYFDTVTVVVRRAPPLTRKTVTVCESGRYRTSVLDLGPGETGVEAFALANGCDSIVEVTVRGVPTLRSTDTLRGLCIGDIVEVGGTRYTARVDTMTLAVLRTPDGCDSVVTTVAEVFDGSEVTVAVDRPACGAETASVTVVMATDVSLTWEDGRSGRTRDDLPTGRMTTLTIGDGGRCSAEVPVTIPEATGPLIALTEATPPLCKGDIDGVIAAELQVARDETYVFELTGPTWNRTNGTELALRAEGLAEGEYWLNARDSRGCTDSLRVTLRPAESVDLEIIGDSIALRAAAASYEITGTGGYDSDRLTWNYGGSHDLPLSTTSDNTVVEFLPTSAGELRASLLLDNGCIETASINLRLEADDRPLFPTAFSPNGDGLNDVFAVVPHRGVSLVLRLAVYSRWGGQVYGSRVGEQPIWDGDGVDVGAYVYVAEVLFADGTRSRITGSVDLIR